MSGKYIALGASGTRAEISAKRFASHELADWAGRAEGESRNNHAGLKKPLLFDILP
jgi:hypothetical protein